MQELKKKYENYRQPLLFRYTDAYNLPSKVIHIVGPIVYGELTKERKRINDCCRKNFGYVFRKMDLKVQHFVVYQQANFVFKRAAGITINLQQKMGLEHQKRKDELFLMFQDEDKHIMKK